MLSKIGEGGMGVVYLARRPGGERVAVKVLRPHIVGDDEARARLAREVSSLSRVHSRWVAEIIDADPWAEVPYVATRYVPGLSLHDEVVEEGPITGRDLTWFAACLAEGLAAVHGAGVLHRDIKPSNVLMEGRTPILIDFGLARVAEDPKLTHTGWLLGTPGYLAPEILYGDDAGAASDVHSWAATVAYAATGHPPFGRGPSMAVMDRVRRGEHDLSGVPGGPQGLRGLLTAALHEDPERRPTLNSILAWLRPQVTTSAQGAAPGPDDVDPFTIPLALVAPPAAGASETATRMLDGGGPDRSRGRAEDWIEDWHPEPATRALTGEPARRGFGADYDDRRDDAFEQHWQQPGWPEEESVRRAGLGERTRRGVLWAAGALAVGAAVTAYPFLVLLTLVVLTWLLRSASSAASAVSDRRRRRGIRWYDAGHVALGAPWHLVRTLPGTGLLLVWSAGLAVAGALVCYAVSAGLVVTVFVAGVVFAVSLWIGPGGSRVRSSIARVVHPAASSLRTWLLALVAVLAVGALLALHVSGSGMDWSPAGGRPFAGYDAPRLPGR